MTIRVIPLMLVAAFLACASSCAKPDWIQQTLVTVDVTGVWIGSTTRQSGLSTFEVRLELEQQGPKVTGSVRQTGPGFGGFGALTGPLDGFIRGDVFSFALTNATAQGELTVTGDEMTGYMNHHGSKLPISFRRVSSTLPASQP